ncbi:amidohydrolase family protein [Erythrobacter sp. W302b]|uniref:metal-dependent hydrolase family protein n=1 Tax=Erythrobacter sp. W302b TaxID=3389874 RepID=UPI00396B25D0
MTVLTNALIFDGVEPKLAEGRSVFTAEGRIVEVSDRRITEADGEVIDCGGLTLIPGMIDAHVHALGIAAHPETVDKAPDTLLTGWASHMLGRMLDRGFTTVRDVGGGDYGLAQALEKGFIRGPRMIYCGRALSQTGGGFDLRDPHDARFNTHEGSCGCGRFSNFAAVVDGVDPIRTAIRENFRRGASFIKFIASGDVTTAGSRLDALEFSDEEVATIVAECERYGTYCTAHVHTDKGIRRAVELGVHCLEHASMVTPETAKLLAERGTFVVATLAVVDSYATRAAEAGLHPNSAAKLEEVRHRMIEAIAILKEAGVTVGLGSDLLGPLESDQLNELTLRADVYSPAEILMQATSINARILRAEGEIGVIREGAHADMVLLRGNPLDTVDVFRSEDNIALVVKGGKIVKQRGEW